MVSLNKFQVRLSNHAIERAKQRIKIENITDLNSIEFEFKLVELIKARAIYFYEDKNKLVYKMVYNNETYKIVLHFLNKQTVLIETIIKS